MIPTLDLDLIRTFLTVVENGGFKGAAEQLHKTPAAISQQIKRLESILNDRVLERNNQGIMLTSTGAILKEKGQHLMQLNYELLGELREKEITGPLRFGAPTDYAPTLLQKLLPVFQKEFPQISPVITLEPSRSLRPKINAGALDLAIVGREAETAEGEALWTEEIAWFGSSKEASEIQRVAVLSTDCILKDRAIRDIQNYKGSCRLVLETATVASLYEAVDAGFCQALLPVSMSNGLRRSPLNENRSSFLLTFCLISGTRFDRQAANQIGNKFRDVVR